MQITTALGLVLISLAIVAGRATLRALRTEPRRLGNAVMIAGTVATGGLGLTLLGSATFAQVVLILLGASPVLAVLLVALLLFNGLTMVRKEGRSLANLLSLLSGLAIAGAMGTAFVLLLHEHTVALSVWIILAGGWIALVFLGFVAYGWLYQQLSANSRPDFIVTLGSGLIGDRVPPLLAARIERAIALHRAEVAAGRAPLLVMSGGKGSDEKVAEAVAMARYARSRGVPEQYLLVEDQSATTEQNLQFTREVIAHDPRLGPHSRGLAVTSNYHVMRAALLARELGLDVQVTGARTAPYFWPSAVIREFVAVMLRTWRWQTLAFVITTLPLPLILATSQWWG